MISIYWDLFFSNVLAHSDVQAVYFVSYRAILYLECVFTLFRSLIVVTVVINKFIAPERLRAKLAALTLFFTLIRTYRSNAVLLQTPR